MNLNIEDLQTWIKTTPFLYASEMVANELLRLYVYTNQTYQVEIGSEILYNGKNIDKAIQNYNEISNS